MMNNYSFELDESQRQATLLALAHLAIERPGWDYMLAQIALKMDNLKSGKPEMFTKFKKTHAVENSNTALAAGFCTGLATTERFQFEPHEVNILKHAGKTLAKLAGVIQ